MIDQELSRYYRQREAAARASGHRAIDARARRMHLEMASMYAKALLVGRSVVDLLDDTPRLHLISDEASQNEAVRLDEAA
ncbi:hypothetical protein QP166_11855 [Sphingomonas sp. LR60]|uniref:hypothetical protein n=1 Tax=Sphingomonas sp. LR60 TaxID=3050233 RepID=UPI002FE05B8A